MNSFYNLPKFLQWIIAIMLAILGFLLALYIIEKRYEEHFYYFLLIIFIPISQFAFTPLFKLLGVYTYYSPMLLGYMANNKQIDLHNGGSFDYLLVMRKYKMGVEMRNKILYYHLEGLLTIIKNIENKSVSENVSIVGTSYFFNERTLLKLGFNMKKPSFFYNLNLYINIIDLCWMYSISKGKLAFPSIWKARKAIIKGENLVAKKEIILQLLKNFNSRYLSY